MFTGIVAAIIAAIAGLSWLGKAQLAFFATKVVHWFRHNNIEAKPERPDFEKKIAEAIARGDSSEEMRLRSERLIYDKH